MDSLHSQTIGLKDLSRLLYLPQFLHYSPAQCSKLSFYVIKDFKYVDKWKGERRGASPMEEALSKKILGGKYYT